MYSTIRLLTSRKVQTNAVRYLRRRRRLINDPGIFFQKHLIQDDNEEETVDFDYEKHETDFMEANKSHSAHEEEMKIAKEKQQLHIVKQKYFKEKYPNFLTWGEKEQIKYLYKTDPEQWTIDKLSEGFPALPEIIKKIVTSEWKKTENKTKNHDNNVNNNWELFKKGELKNLPPLLVKHLKKFSNRPLNEMSTPTFYTQLKTVEFTNTKNEFKDIVDLNTKTCNLEEEKKPLQKPPTKDSFLLPGIKSHRLKQLKMDKVVSEPVNAEIEDSVQKVQLPSKVVKYAKSQIAPKKPELTAYPETITIPSDKQKKHCIYKLNDCFYDFDGKFLYRVPGLIN